MAQRGLWAKYCGRCIHVRDRESMANSRKRHPQPKGALKAHSAVAAAIRKGFLPRPETSLCVDCKFLKAQCYDHWDYNRPLVVEPVCYSCNIRRGPAIPHIDDAQPPVGGTIRKTKEAKQVA